MQTSLDFTPREAGRQAAEACLDETTTEEWRGIHGLEGRYEVSCFGRVRNVITAYVLGTSLDSHGYPRLMAALHGKRETWPIHRAVLVAFMPRPDWKTMHVNHKDGVTTNNTLSNLEWCTASENRLHSYRVLKRPNPMAGVCGAMHHNARAVVGRCIASGESRSYGSMAETKRDGFRGTDISACIRGRQKTHRGWVWTYGVVR